MGLTLATKEPHFLVPTTHCGHDWQQPLWEREKPLLLLEVEASGRRSHHELAWNLSGRQLLHGFEQFLQGDVVGLD